MAFVTAIYVFPEACYYEAWALLGGGSEQPSMSAALEFPLPMPSPLINSSAVHMLSCFTRMRSCA